MTPCYPAAPMGQTLIIAEKPSVGQDYARALGVGFAQPEGYLGADGNHDSGAVGECVLRVLADLSVWRRGAQALNLTPRGRDEALRLPVKYPRKLRGDASTPSVVDAIPGIGPTRKRALLRKFGSVRVLQDTSVDEIATTPGFTRRLAETVKRRL